MNPRRSVPDDDGGVPPGFLHDWVFHHASLAPERVAVATPRMRLTYQALAQRVAGLGLALLDHGIRPKERVMVALPNLPATVVISLALHAVGAVPVEVDRTWGAETLEQVAARAGVSRAFVWWQDAERWRRAGHELSIGHVMRVTQAGVSTGEGGLSLDADADTMPLASVTSLPRVERPRPSELALIIYTSGSSGAPHGVGQTFRNIVANTCSIVAYLHLGPDDRALLTLPLHYCYGRSVLQTHLARGGSVVLEGRTAFPASILESLREHECTGLPGVPLTFEMLRRQGDVAGSSFPRLRYVTQAGGAMAPETIAWAVDAFAPAEVFVMYGQTEATARLSYVPPESALRKLGSIGIPIPGVELRVTRPDGSEAAVGEVGELMARGENVTPGYVDDPEATASILRDGWLWTGDLASRDQDGFLFHEGRAKEILKVGGHRVSPSEIESVIASHPGVAEVAVVGRPDPLMGETPVAFLVVRSPSEATPDELKAFCSERLPRYKMPVRFVSIEAMPRTSSGKLARDELRHLALEA
jgi:acyl-CoA synthetase (AMP-forming)/AMP-acid ligase II